jgi:hypothetical protein
MISFSGEWNIFSGNQIGIVLASATLENYKAQGKPISMIKKKNFFSLFFFSCNILLFLLTSFINKS